MSFEQYATRRLPAMLGTARAICVDDALAEDLVQDVLIKLNEKWASISQMDAVDAYVRRMLVNEYLSWRRKWSRLLPFAEPGRQRRGAESTSEDFASAHAELDVLVREIRRLPARQRAVIGLRYFADLSDEQIADVLGSSQSTVRVQAGRALTALRVVRTDPSLAHHGRRGLMTRTEEDLRAAYNTPLDAAALQRLSVTIGELSGSTWPEPRPRSRGRRLAPLLSAAAVLLLAGGVAVGLNHGHDRITGSAASSTDNEDPALRLWAQFPVHASPRPVVLTEGAVKDPTTGFPNGEDKLAYMSGRFELDTALPPGRTTKDGQRVITAQRALTVLGGAGRGQSATTPLKITDVRLGTDTFSTDRGQRSLPAWLFTFAGVAQPASVVALSDPWPHSGMPSTPGERLMSVTSATTAADGHRLTISFQGAAPGSGPCSADYAADVGQSATAVSVSVRMLPAPSPSSVTVCATVAYERTLTVTLTSPLGDRVLIDTTGVPVPVT